MSKPINRIYEFGQFRLDTAERLLVRGGTPVSLTPKAFETLLVLVQSSGRLVHKDDLMKQVWPDAIVEEANLARNVWTLRKALGDSNGERYIETIPTVGYRFVAPIKELPPQGDVLGVERTVHAPIVGAAEHAPDVPLPAPPKKNTRRVFPVALTVVLAVGLISAGLIRYWPKRSPSGTAQTRLTILSDGSHDDTAAYWTNSGQIYFSRAITNTRTETWTMNADGTNPRRANTAIATLLTGRWSPDGRKVIFRKDDGRGAIYLADADGANEIALSFVPGNLDWSPDGSKFVYQARDTSGRSEIFLYSLDTGKTANLTNTPASNADPSFSSDGSRIAFTSWRDGNAEIYVMQADGSNVLRVTNHPAFDSYPVFSPDDTQIAFQSNRDDERIEVYRQNLNDSTPPTRLTRSSTTAGLAPKCWSPDGTQVLVYTNRNGKDQIELINVEPLQARLLLGDEAADLSFPRVSASGTRLLYEAMVANRSLELRVIDLNTKRTRTLFKTEPDYPINFHLEPAWSPDESLVAFSVRANGNSEIFVMKADGSGLRNVTRNPLLDTSPAFSRNGKEIVFARDTYGQAQLFRTDLTGDVQRRLTDKPGYEMNPAVSPDGHHLAFAGDRESHGLDIFLLDLARPNDETLLAARRSQDGSPSFSPDGRRIAFIAASDGHPEIYVMNSDGTGLFRVTHSKDEKAAPQFSADGRHIIFSSNRAGRFALYQIDAR